ncbi:single-stranded DNA-binding protein [Nocardioides sp. YIM 123512]|uniref:Single-stranded DNA-binding protein n=2 Tax=Nocardioides flavescens TaxID=2691959 RepID=A0A6L7F4K4_9ACTN|nr:single-stranded DNA-binding protein [Nocardioides flavescens]MXG92134.1 single-stranded DNA-binding protein [Nocardioides flavescens]
MSAQKVEENALAFVNEVRVAGRVSGVPEERELPSGDVVLLVRVVVDRPSVAGERRRVDTVDCAVWAKGLRRRVSGWRPDDMVEVEGALRRRFYRSAGGGTLSRVEVEVTAARITRRATTG